MNTNVSTKFQMACIALSFILAAIAPNAQAANEEDRIGSVTTSMQDAQTGEWKPIGIKANPKFSRQALVQEALYQPMQARAFTQLTALPVAAIAEFIKVGKEVWDVIKDNKAVYDIQTDNVSVLPKGATEPMQLANWEESASPSLKIEIDDILGGNMMTFVYHINYNYNGNYQGKGAYLANITMVPENLDLHAIGLKFQASVQTLSPVNSGSKTAPVAQLKVLVPLKADGWLSSAVKTDEFTISGDGKINVVQRSDGEWK